MPVPKFPANCHKLNPASCFDRDRWCLAVLEVYQIHSTNLPTTLTPQTGLQQGLKHSTRTYPKTLAQHFSETLSNLDRKKRRVGSLLTLPHLIKFSNQTCYSLAQQPGTYGKELSLSSVGQTSGSLAYSHQEKRISEQAYAPALGIPNMDWHYSVKSLIGALVCSKCDIQILLFLKSPDSSNDPRHKQWSGRSR